jgi:AbrB family looped-hinge helix DNA binding protein
MPTTHIFRDKKGRTVVHIPSFLRDKFNLQSGEKVTIDTDGEYIIIKPIKKDA